MAKIFAELLTSGFKFAKPIFACEKWTVKFEKASVYIVKFQQYLQHFYESGINRALEFPQKYQIRFSNEEGENNPINASQLILILGGGYVISFLVFLIEHLTKHFCILLINRPRRKFGIL